MSYNGFNMNSGGLGETSGREVRVLVNRVTPE